MNESQIDISKHGLGARIIAVVALFLVVLGACKKWEDKMETGRQALIASATPCPSPATCSAKMTVSQRQVSTCSAPPAEGKMYAVGDTVVVKDLGGIDILARVKEHEGSGYRVEFAEGVINSRPASAIVAQVCR
jgi:hypothetical protein